MMPQTYGAGQGYNDPAMASAATSIARMFAPPSGADMAGFGQAALARQRAGIIQQMYANPSDPNFDKVNILLGNETGTNSIAAQNQNNETSRANNAQTNQYGLMAKLYGTPVGAGEVMPAVPQNMADKFGVQSTGTTGLPTTDTVKAIAFNNMPQSAQTENIMSNVTPVMAKDANGKPIYENPQQAVATRAQPAVVQGSSQQAFQAADGGLQATDYHAILDGGKQALGRIQVLDALDQASKSAGYQGIGGSNAMAMRQALAGFGLDTKSESDAEVLASGGSQLALQLRNPANGGGMPGSMSDQDRQFLTNMVAGLDHTPQGNQRLIAVAKAIAQRDVDTARMAQQYVAKNGQMDGGFTTQLADYAQANPLFPQQQGAGPATKVVGGVTYTSDGKGGWTY